MVWGCVTSKSVGTLHRIEGRMDAEMYTQILQSSLLSTLKKLRITKKYTHFAQDNDPKHKSKLAMSWFESHHVHLLPWASSSPDMNIIEHVWDYLDSIICARKEQPKNKEEFWKVL